MPITKLANHSLSTQTFETGAGWYGLHVLIDATAALPVSSTAAH
jgi:hypothetical protein